jgi:hypothetical protein
MAPGIPVVALLFFAFAHLASAQSKQPCGAGACPAERPGAVYISGLLNIPWSQGVTADGFQVYRLPPGGWSLGWSVLGGVFVAGHASVEFEFVRTGVLERTEPSRYNTTYHPQRQDTFFTTAVRLHARPHRLVDVEPVLGFDIVREEISDAPEYTPYTGGPAQQSSRWYETLPAAAGFSAGADVRFGSGRAAFVASVRIHRSFWGGSGDFDETKVWTVRPGIGMRVLF